MNIETALTFENADDGSSLQLDIDANGYSVTVYDADGSIASMSLGRASLVRLTNFLTDTIFTETE